MRDARSEIARRIDRVASRSTEGKTDRRHDDADREFDYTAGAEDVLAEARDSDWTVVSIKDDWSTVFAESADA